MTRFLLMASLMLAASCGQKSDTAHHQDALKKFEKSRQQLTTNFSFRPNYPKPAGTNPKTFATNFCNFISVTPSPFELEKHIAGDSALQTLQGQLTYLAQNNLGCTYSKEIYNHFPLQMVEYKTSVGYSIYLHFLYDQNYKVTQSSISLQPGSVDIDHVKIPARDGQALSTFIFKSDNTPKGTILIRTPYYHTGAHYLSMADNFLRKGFHVAIQSNRGSYLSDGEFRWLSNQNGEDGYDTIEFLAAQDFSNGKVVSYGVSYDGFNALATGIETPPSLAGIIACSAPANAATDSFTSNKVTESHLLNYVWQRETNSPIEHFMSKYLYLAQTNTPKSEYDNKIFGRDVADWDDYLKDPKKYFQERNLLPGLNKINVPTIHVAGLTNDQDGRDTILAYESLQANAVNKNLHKLLLHEQGHGCGPFGTTTEFDNYLQQSSDNAPNLTGAKVRQFSKTLAGYAEGVNYPLAFDFKEKNIQLAGAVQRMHQNLNPADFAILPIGLIFDSIQPIGAQYKQNSFLIDIQNKTIVNGSPKLKLKALAQAPGTVIYADIVIVRPDGSTKTFNGVQRSAYLWDKALNSIEDIEINLPPTLTTLSPESQIYIQVTTEKSWIITPDSQARDDYYANSPDPYSSVVFFTGSEFTIPTEASSATTANPVL